MEDQERIIELSRLYWEALEELDWAGADFYASALERMGAERLPKSEVKELA